VADTCKALNLSIFSSFSGLLRKAVEVQFVIIYTVSLVLQIAFKTLLLTIYIVGHFAELCSKTRLHYS
jgi:hypothetical protein